MNQRYKTILVICREHISSIFFRIYPNVIKNEYDDVQMLQWSSSVEMWPPVTYTEGIPDRKHSGYIQYTYRGFTLWHLVTVVSVRLNNLFFSAILNNGEYLEMKNANYLQILTNVFLKMVWIPACSSQKCNISPRKIINFAFAELQRF